MLPTVLRLTSQICKTFQSCREFVMHSGSVEIFTVYVNSLTYWTVPWRHPLCVTGCCCWSSRSVLLFALRPVAAYVCKCQVVSVVRVDYDNTACRDFGVSGEQVRRVACWPGHESVWQKAVRDGTKWTWARG